MNQMNETLFLEVSPLAKDFIAKHPLSKEEEMLQMALFFYPYMLNGEVDIGVISKLMGISRIELMNLYEKAEVPIHISHEPINMDRVNSLAELINQGKSDKESVRENTDMEYTLKLIFSPKANMEKLLQKIKSICNGNGTVLLKHAENSITLGADSFESFSPALIDIRYDDYIKANLIDAYCTDPFDGTYPCLDDILKNYT